MSYGPVSLAGGVLGSIMCIMVCYLVGRCLCCSSVPVPVVQNPQPNPNPDQNPNPNPHLPNVDIAVHINP
jgi:hypothetical protein